MNKGLPQKPDPSASLAEPPPVDSRPILGFAALDGAAADARLGSSSDGSSNNRGSSGESRRDGGAESGAEEPPPNVIFILIDDVGMNDFGPNSTDLSTMTPFMESLAADGVRISRHYSNHICTPSRVSLVHYIQAKGLCAGNS